MGQQLFKNATIAELAIAEGEALRKGYPELAAEFRAARWTRAMGMVVNRENWLNEPKRGLTVKTFTERQWQKPKLAPAPQKPCDHGLFSDEALQLDLVEMLQEPDYE